MAVEVHFELLTLFQPYPYTMNTFVGAMNWHVVYTMAKSEKKVAASISEMGIECFLPVQKVIRQWSDRKKKIEVPLFPNYVFVHVDHAQKFSLFSVKQIVRFITIERKPVVIKETEIAMIKKALCINDDVCSEEYFHQGMKVRITNGQFAGLEGIVIRKNGVTRLLIKIDVMMKAFSISIPATSVIALPGLEKMRANVPLAHESHILSNASVESRHNHIYS